jgi:hypothetical protein
MKAFLPQLAADKNPFVRKSKSSQKRSLSTVKMASQVSILKKKIRHSVSAKSNQ